MNDPASGEWNLLSTEVTDKTGRISYTIPDSKALSYGLYPLKMVVRWESLHFFAQNVQIVLLTTTFEKFKI